MGTKQTMAITTDDPNRGDFRFQQRNRPFPVDGKTIDDLLVDVMSPGQRRCLRILVGGWAVSLLVFYLWWFRLEHIASPMMFVINSLLLTWTLGLPAYFCFFLMRMKRVNPHVEIPQHWRVAMVTTRAPSEPFSVVQKTLEAMLAQGFPHETWLADEDPSEEIYRWCQEHGAHVSTRRGVSEYHRDQWPRRTKCKEGNLAYFYDRYGYEKFDFVVQLDADHVPEPGYLEAMLRPFTVDSVGYVSAPSICNANAKKSWSARGRLFTEGNMHGPLQAGYTNGFSPQCIGSHYAVRTQALREIGGLGPELAEDHSTTLMMNGHGWRGVHAMDAIAYGEGPPTLAACITQEFQWSRSLMVVLLTVLPRFWRQLPWRLRFQYLFCELWYPFFGLSLFIGLLLPVFATLSKQPLVQVSYVEFLLHSIPAGLLIVAITSYIRKQGWMRPKDCKVLSWELALFQVIRWPWVLYGSLMGVMMAIRKKNVVFRITPKGAKHPESLPWKILLPNIVVVVFSFLPSLIVADAGTANGYFFFLIVAQLVYVLALLSMVLVHRYEVTKIDR